MRIMSNKSFLLLCGNTNRSKFYINLLAQRKDIDLELLYYGYDPNDADVKGSLVPSDSTVEYFNSIDYSLPDLNDSIIRLIQKTGLECTYIEESDVNSPLILEIIKSKAPNYVIFSGYGGQILNNEHFVYDSFYLHCHPGKLPSERGSTTMYYSILNDRDFTVTAFRMTSDIDAGSVVYEESFPRPKGIIDIDVFGDCGMRTITLGKAIDKIVQAEEYHYLPETNNQEYYVIHPLLKHISILSLIKKKKLY